jgi:GNAT superfamily N-acetyltransferase
MNLTLRSCGPSDLADIAQHPALAARPVDAARLHHDAPDAHWLALRDGVAVARASLWWHDVPAWNDAPLGYVGHYAAADAEAGRAVLEHGAQALARHGVARAVGPIDGNTWRAYRLVVERGDLPPFFLEPQNPDDWPTHFAAAGFTEFAHYTSALVEHIEIGGAKVEAAQARLAAAGYRFRGLNLEHVDRELDALFDVSLAAFAQNLLYTPISREEFLAQYAQILPKIDPRLVLLAERDGAVAGYVFALPDLLEAARTGASRTVIVKTLAVHPAHAGSGIGGVLTELCQQAALALSYTRVIHALMLDTNVSQRISQRYGRAFRRYALFSRVLP